jgi:hypothetical protein
MGWGVVFAARFYLPEMMRAFSGCVNYKASQLELRFGPTE